MAFQLGYLCVTHVKFRGKGGCCDILSESVKGSKLAFSY